MKLQHDITSKKLFTRLSTKRFLKSIPGLCDKKLTLRLLSVEMLQLQLIQNSSLRRQSGIVP